MSKSFKKIVLGNGLRIILNSRKESLTTTVLVLVATGSKYETKEISGISHFLEHLCFKGTTNRPTALKITSELDALGAEYNAFTGEEYTGYHAKADARHTDKILEIVSDLYVNPIIPKEEIEKEKGVIIEEINMYEDLPMRKVQEVFTELLYGDQPAGWPIAGKKEIIRRLTREEIVKYRGAHYVANATAIIVSGGFNEKKILEKIGSSFKNILTAKKDGKVKTEDRQSAPALKIQPKESDQTHLVLGVRAYNVSDERRFALGVLADILGGGMSSRLFQKVRDELGAAYYIRASVESHSDHGYLGIAAGVDHKKLEIVVKATLEECGKIRRGEMINEEIQRAKNHMSGNLLLGLETSDATAMFYGGQEILKEKLMTPQELLKNINAVRKKNIIAVAEDIFRNEKLNLAVIGPVNNVAPLKKILKFS